jgi:DNA polymerase III alpha subunit (gram-positive type)
MGIFWQVVDIETTGLDSKVEEVAELAIVTCHNTDVINIFHKYYEVKKMGEVAGKVNGLTEYQLKGWPKFNSNENINIVRGILKYPYFAHNVDFDRGFLLASNVVNPDLRYIDTVKLCKIKPTKLENNKLQTWLKYFNIDAGAKHSALGDSLGLARLIILQGWQIKVIG